MNTHQALLRGKLNAETGRMDWPALSRHFARGAVLTVGAGLDLVEVALAMASDDTTAMGAWLKSGQVAKATTEHAMLWNEQGATFWAVVVAPWVLVQLISPDQVGRSGISQV